MTRTALNQKKYDLTLKTNKLSKMTIKCDKNLDQKCEKDFEVTTNFTENQKNMLKIFKVQCHYRRKITNTAQIKKIM